MKFQNSKRWTKDPKCPSDIHSGVGSQKHKKVGYQVFKDKYIGKVEVKANVVMGKMSCFLVKGCVNAAIIRKKILYMFI